jgi:hypothetical protein
MAVTIIVTVVCVLCRRRRRERRRARQVANGTGIPVTSYGTPAPYIIPQPGGELATAATMPLGTAGFPTPNLTVPIQPYVSTLNLPQSTSTSHGNIGGSSEYDTEDSEKRRVFPPPMSLPKSSRRASTIPTTTTTAATYKHSFKPHSQHVGGEIKSNSMAQSTEDSGDVADDEQDGAKMVSSPPKATQQQEETNIKAADLKQQPLARSPSSNIPSSPSAISHPLADHDFFDRQQFPPASHEALQPIATESLSSGNPFMRDGDFSLTPEFTSAVPSPSPSQDSEIPPRKPRRRRS